MEGTIATRAGPSYVVPKRDWGGASAKAGTSALYRAPTREWAGLVQIVHGQGSQDAVVCRDAPVVEIVMPANQHDGRGLCKCGGILDGNRHSVAAKLVSGEKTDSGCVRASTERAGRRPGESVEVHKPGLAPYNVEAGWYGQRNDVGSLVCEHRGNRTPRYVSVADATRACRTGRACGTSWTGWASRARRPLWSGCASSSGRPCCPRHPWRTG